MRLIHFEWYTINFLHSRVGFDVGNSVILSGYGFGVVCLQKECLKVGPDRTLFPKGDKETWHYLNSRKKIASLTQTI